MTEQTTKRSLVATKAHYEKNANNFEQQLRAFIESKSDFKLKLLLSRLETLQKQCDSVSEKGKELMESEDEDMRKYGEKEMEDIIEKFSDVQKRLEKAISKTEAPKTETGAGMFSRSGGGLNGIFSNGFRGEEKVEKKDLENPEEDLEDIQDGKIPRNDGRAKRKDDPIPVWRPKVTFDAWESNLRQWMKEVKYTDHQYITRLFQMLQGKDVTEEVRDFMIKFGERREECRNTVAKVLTALQDKFGESKEEKYNTLKSFLRLAR